MANPRDNKPVVHTRKHLARLERERRQTRLILFAFIGIVILAVGLIGYGYLDLNYLQARRPVARVGNVDLSLGEWQARVRLQRSSLINQIQLYAQYAQVLGMDLSSQEQQLLAQLNDSNTLGQQVLDTMINEELIRQEAAKRGITASPAEVEALIQGSYNYYPSGTPTPSVTPTSASTPTYDPTTLALVTLTPSPTAVVTSIGSATATLSLTESPTATLSAGISPTASTTPVPSFSPTPTESATPTETAGPSPTATGTATATPTATPYTLQAFQTAYQNSVKNFKSMGLTDAQIQQIYETSVLHDKLFAVITANVPHTQDEVWARHILVADEASANVVRQRLLGGEDFAKVAAEVSTDTATKNKGGDLGWFAKGAMVPEFDAAAFSLKVGEISQPVKSQFGYHIIEVLARTEMPLDAAAYAQAQQTAFNDWLKNARTEYKVVTYNNWQNVVPTDPAAPVLPQ